MLTNCGGGSGAGGSMGPASSLLVHAVNQGDVHQVQALALEGGAHVNARNSLGESCVHVAAARGCRSVLELVLALGADPNVAMHLQFGGHTPLHIAVQRGHVAILETLLLHDGDPNIPDATGKTPLHDAARRGDVVMVELLLRHGCALRALDAARMTALDYSVRARHVPVSECLRTWLRASVIGDAVPSGSGAYATVQAAMTAKESQLSWRTTTMLPPGAAKKGAAKGKAKGGGTKR